MTASPALSALQAAFPAEQIAQPGSGTFDDRIKSYLSLLQSKITPSAMFLPKSKEEIASFLKILQEHGERFAIRGGGQQPLPGCSNIEGGITLDLVNITGVELNDKNDIVSIGAGERWGAVYNKLHEKGLSVTGARSGNNGVGGLALSGGLSFFSSREGLVCDNVVNYQVVLASGQVVDTNEKENADLFKALRGGGNNFGVVTRFDMRTFKQGPFWGGSVFYFPEQFPGQIDALVDELIRPDAS
jgi:FAD/FMN-containing dehydrogenase